MPPDIRNAPVLPGEATQDEARIGWLRQQLSRLRKRLPLRRRFVGGAAHGLMSASAALIAYIPTQALSLREGFWSAITAIAVVQTEFRATRSMARDQFLGAATGGLIGLAVLGSVGQDLVAYALAVILSLTACWLLNVASAGRLAGITATIILLVPHYGTAQRMFGSRLLEVGWGVTVAVAVGWVATRLMHGAEDGD
ncbi:FUSC family protein [Methylobacterium gossipiicola]|uniref:Fusaric acid resistance protein-like n=1 Tax=Methylobacterium gossipiicola TaxID=582675 RepID=A0A1I2VSN9_9HYPH|nr:FUSC family protein [Methylobacterium gossipiicola]SFG92053.1 Fusaric acid resistance protein-like [Methylobacterium gossipiicola]